MRRLVLLAALGAGLGCTAPAKRPFTAADLGAERAAVTRGTPVGGIASRGASDGLPTRHDPGLGGPGRGDPGTGGVAELRVLADGRLVLAGEPASLAGALVRFDAARTGGTPAAARQAWRELLAAVDEALAGVPPPRLELLRVSTACETALAELAERDPALAAQVQGAVSARLAVLEERLSAPPGERLPSPRRRFGFPLEPVVVTSFFGPRADPFDGRQRWHLGVDLQAESGQAIHAAAGGQVISAGWAGGHGQRVELAHDDGAVTGYSHLSAILVEPGATVEAGQPIGLAGATGRATGPHLHFELWRDGEPEDPLEVLGDEAVEIRTGALLE